MFGGLHRCEDILGHSLSGLSPARERDDFSGMGMIKAHMLPLKVLLF